MIRWLALLVVLATISLEGQQYYRAGGGGSAATITPGILTGTDAVNFGIDQVGTDNPADRVNFTGDLASDSFHFVDGLSTDSTLRVYFNSTIQWNSNGSLRVNHGITDLFMQIADNGANNADSLAFRRATESTTTTKTMSTQESNFVYICSDADGSIYTLPNDPTLRGSFWTVMVGVTQTTNSCRINPPAGETLRYNNAACSSLTATARDATIDVMVTTAGAGGIFTALRPTGTWTCNP
jgi:hypothetical protein